MSEAVFIALFVAVAYVIGVAIARWHQQSDEAVFDSLVAREIGYQQAAQGFGPDDYPIDYSDAERDAWRRGWDEYHERK